MKTAGRIALYILAAPRFLGWLFPLLAFVCFAATDLRLIDDAVLVATWRPWVTKRWKYSQCLLAGMVLQPGASARTMAHERVHVRQGEDGTITGLLLGIPIAILSGEPAWFFVLWFTGSMHSLSGWITAVLRGGHVYRDSESERSAYAQTDLRPDGSSWLSDHESREQTW
jgi:hypothetical protein